MLDLLLRGGAIGAIAMVALVLLADKHSRRQGLPVAVIGLMISACLMASAPAADDLPSAAMRVLVLGATLVPLAFAWMILDLLTDPTLRRWPWLVLVLAASSVVASTVIPFWPAAFHVRDSGSGVVFWR